NVTAYTFRFAFAEAKVWLGDIAVDHFYFFGNETMKGAAIAFAQRIKNRRSNDVIPESGFAFVRRWCADHQIDFADVRKTMQQHTEANLAKEARAAEEENLAALINFCWR